MRIFLEKKNPVLYVLLSFLIIFSTVNIPVMRVNAGPATETKDGFEFQKNSDGIKIISYVGSDKNVTIPATIDGVPVKTVGRQTFVDRYDVETITISEGVENLEPWLADGCYNLRELTISSTARPDVGSSAAGFTGFVAGCWNLEKVNLASNNPYLCLIDGILYDAGKTTILVCPAKLNVKNITIPEGVTSINDDCFSYNKIIEKVSLPSTVTYIGYWAFDHCSSLKEVNIPVNCTFVGQFAFTETAIKELIIPKDFEGWIVDGALGFNGHVKVESGNKKYAIKNDCLIYNNSVLLFYNQDCGNDTCVIPEEINNIGCQAFMYAKNLKKVVFHEGITVISGHTFYQCESLEEINLPKSLEEIGYSSFCNCYSLKKVTIPEAVNKIGDNAFAGTAIESIKIPKNVSSIGEEAFSCTNTLNEIVVDANNSYYSSVDGVLYDKAVKRVVCVPYGIKKEYVFPDTVEEIDNWAFLDANIESLYINARVKKIGRWAFGPYTYNIFIPKTVKEIGEESIYSLNVFYEGSAEDWGNVKLDNQSDDNYKIFFNSTKESFLEFVSNQDYYERNQPNTQQGDQQDNRSDDEQDAVTDFVKRLYKVVLGRDDAAIESDKAGINDWVSKLKSKEKTGAQIARGFVMSKEFTNRNLSDDEFVKIMYRAFFDREPDEGGYNGWIQKLKDGTTREEVLAGFTNSKEFSNFCNRYGIEAGKLEVSGKTQQNNNQNNNQQNNTIPKLKVDSSNVNETQLTGFVERLYTNVLGRSGEAEGVEDWKNTILNSKNAGGKEYDAATVVSEGFFNSKEYKNKNTDNKQFVADCYMAFFNRDPRGTDDEVNYNDWVRQLDEGSITRTQMIEKGFGHSKEFKNLLTSYGFKIIE